MKKYILLLVCASIALSCSGILEKYPHDSVSPASVGSSDLVNMRNGMYNMVQSSPGERSYIAFDIFGSDLVYCQFSAPINYINNSMTSYSTIISNQWDGYYESLYQVNNFIAAAEKYSDDADVQTYLGEAHYFRALIYTNLVTRWGKVPILRQNTTEKVARDPVDEVWAFIDEELAAAESLLGDSESYYYVSLNAVKALKARVLLYEGKGSEAATVAEEVISSGDYALDSFDNIFGTGTNDETIFAFANLSTEDGLYLGEYFFTYNYVNKGGGWFYVLDSVYEEFEDGDVRKDQGIYIETLDPTTMYHYCVNKYRGGQSYTSPLIVSRIAEMYLISAEGQGYPNGLGRLNELRKERGLTELSSGDLNATTFTDAVIKERRFEFMGENHRYYDLVRSGKALEEIDGLQSYQLVFPVPDSQRVLNDLLDQNEGY